MKCDYKEAMKEFEQYFAKGCLAIKKNNDKCVIVQDSTRKELPFGKIEYKINKNFYNLRLPNGEKLRLFYSNLEKVFTNNKRA